MFKQAINLKAGDVVRDNGMRAEIVRCVTYEAVYITIRYETGDERTIRCNPFIMVEVEQ